MATTVRDVLALDNSTSFSVLQFVPGDGEHRDRIAHMYEYEPPFSRNSRHFELVDGTGWTGPTVGTEGSVYRLGRDVPVTKVFRGRWMALYDAGRDSTCSMACWLLVHPFGMLDVLITPVADEARCGKHVKALVRNQARRYAKAASEDGIEGGLGR